MPVFFEYVDRQVDALHVGSYWSEVLCCIIMTHLSDLEFKVKVFEILC